MYLNFVEYLLKHLHFSQTKKIAIFSQRLLSFERLIHARILYGLFIFNLTTLKLSVLEKHSSYSVLQLLKFSTLYNKLRKG